MGLALFVFAVLPTMNVLKAVMLTNCVCLVPGVFGMLSRYPDRESRGKWVLQVSIDVLAILFQVSGLFLWPLFSAEESSPKPWLQPLAVFLISCGWWENYVDVNSPFGPIRALGKVRRNLDIKKTTRYFVYIFISLFKILAFFSSMMAAVWIAGGNVNNLFAKFSEGWSSHQINVTEVSGGEEIYWTFC